MAAVVDELEIKDAATVFKDIERFHTGAAQHANYVYSVMSYPTEELDENDIRVVIDRLNKLKMNLEQMECGFMEYRKLKESPSK